MKRIITLAVLILIGSMNSFGQTRVSGRIVDSNHRPMEYAGAVLCDADSSMIAGTLADTLGNFSIDTDANASYLRVSMLGYRTLTISSPSGNLGEIVLEDDAALDAASVKAVLPKTVIKGDALETRIEGTVLEHSGSAADMLDKIPGVEANGEGVSVYGRGTAQVYLNGREVRDLKELSRLSSDMVKSVEVIQNPGARYSSSVKAVVRIYTKKHQGDGFSFDNELRYTFQYGNDLWENLATNYRKGGLDFGVTLWGNIQHNGKNQVTDQYTYLTNDTWKQSSDTQVRQKSLLYAPTLTFNWQIDEKHSLGMRYNWTEQPWLRLEGSYMDTQVSRDGEIFEHSRSEIPHVGEGSEHSINAYYNGRTDNGWGIDVNADVYLSDDRMNGHTIEYVTDMSTRAAYEPIEVKSLSVTRNQLYAGKAVFSHILLNGQFSFGTEDSYTVRNTDYSISHDMIDDSASRITEEVLAGFAEYGRVFAGKLYLNAGLRFEHTGNDYYVYGKRMDDQSRTYNDFFPSLTLSMPIGKIQTSLSYSRDISRPSYGALRSNIMYDNKYTYEGGNPFLKPEYDDDITVDAVWNWLRFSASYQHISNQVSMFSGPFDEEHPEISYIRPFNVDPYNTGSLSIIASPSFGPWTPIAFVAARFQDYMADTPDGQMLMNHPLGQFQLQNRFSFKDGANVILSYSYVTHGHQANTEITKALQQCNISAFKSFLKGRIEAQLQIIDVFSQMNQCVKVYNGSRVIEQEMYARPYYMVSLKYRFNSAASKYKGGSAGSSQKSRM